MDIMNMADDGLRFPEFNPQTPSPPPARKLRTLEEITREYDERREREALSENETEFDPEELEAAMDECPSPDYKTMSCYTPEYLARRRARKPLMSPPPTPPHVKARRKRDSSHRVQKPQKTPPTPQEIRRAKRMAPRCPRTRSKNAESISLHHTRGKVLVQLMPWKFIVVSYDEYLREHVSNSRNPRGCENANIWRRSGL